MLPTRRQPALPARRRRPLLPVPGRRPTLPTRRREPTLADPLHRLGVRAWHLQAMSLSSIALCIGLWIRAKTVDQDERGNAERRALFVGLWPPMIWLIGDTLAKRESS
jgi:hypothetical protein